MKRLLIMTVCIAAMGLSSCDDKTRLDEIKAELKEKQKKAEKSDEEEKPKVSISAPSQNEPPAPVEAVEMEGDAYGYDATGENSDDYSGDSYEDSDYSGD